MRPQTQTGWVGFRRYAGYRSERTPFSPGSSRGDARAFGRGLQHSVSQLRLNYLSQFSDFIRCLEKFLPDEKTAFALVGLGGFNAHGAGFLAAARGYKIVPALIMATSVQITVLADWLQ
jgi:hypothetical protein